MRSDVARSLMRPALRLWRRGCWLLGLCTLALASDAGAQAEWHGFERRDLEIAGRGCIVVAPQRPAAGRPWIWRARFFGHQPQVDVALLGRGFHLVYMDVAGLFGGPEALRCWDACYAHMTRELGLAAKPALEGMSRGGLVVFNWAAANPERVACIYVDAPVLDIRSWPGGRGRGRGSPSDWKRCLAVYELTAAGAATFRGNPVDRLRPLARAGVPVLCVCGADDAVVPIEENAEVAQARYREYGGRFRMIVKPGVGHHPHSLADPAAIVQFVARHTGGSGDYFVLRDGLANARRRFARDGVGRVAFLGGSITHNAGWRDLVCAELGKQYTAAEFDFINAGIPSFGSTPGAFRFERDVLARGQVDLLFVEAAVNDSTNGRTAAEQLRGMEGIVRRARAANPAIDIVMLHFVDPAKMREIRRGVVPTVIATHERVAAHYGIPSLDLALEVTERIDAGEFTWADDFVNLHPSPFGQRLYFQSIVRLLAAAWSGPVTEELAVRAMPERLDAFSYANGRYMPVDAARLGDGWRIEPAWRPTDGAGTRAGFVGVPVLVGDRPGAELEYEFVGSAVGVLVVAGPDAGVVEFSVDGGAFDQRELLTRWSKGLHLPWSYVLAAELAPGPHRLRLRLADRPGDDRARRAARIVYFLVNGGG